MVAVLNILDRRPLSSGARAQAQGCAVTVGELSSLNKDKIK